MAPTNGIPIIDAHGHTLDLAFESQQHLHRRLGGLTDVPLMRSGGVVAQLNACWVPDSEIGGPHANKKPLQKVLQMVDYLHRELASEAGDHAALALCANDVDTARGNGKVALILGLEGGDAIKGDLSLLRMLHRLGLRHLGLVHEGRNALGTATQVWEGPRMRLYDSSVDPPGGLSSAGKDFVREMNRLGMLVDVTHMEEATFWDTLNIARAPVIVTHGNARSLRDSPRYLSDEQIRAVAETGGLICPSPTPLGPSDETPSLEGLVDHIDHMVELIGPEHVGWGSDFLGQTDNRPHGLGDIGDTPNIQVVLHQRNHSAEVIQAILGGNFMRVFRTMGG